MQEVHREVVLLVLSGEDLEGQGVVGDGGDVVGVEPQSGLHGEPSRGEGVGDLVAAWAGVAVGGGGVEVEGCLLTGPDEDQVAGSNRDSCELHRSVEVGGRDGVAGGECIGAVHPGHVEEHAATNDGGEVLDPQDGGTGGGDRISRKPVVEGAAVGDVAESIPVSGGLNTHRQLVF